MKLVVFGATGGTGRQVIAQALAAGHRVTAFVRRPEKLGIADPNLVVVQGDVLDQEAVGRAIVGQDAVVSTLGAPASQRDRVRSEGTDRIIRAMDGAGVRRFICLTTMGMGDSRALLPLTYKLLIVPLILRDAFADSERQEGIIRRSHLAWTIVRPAALTDGAHTGRYRHGFTTREQGLKTKISRADVADFIVKQLADEGYLHQAPCLSY